MSYISKKNTKVWLLIWIIFWNSIQNFGHALYKVNCTFISDGTTKKHPSFEGHPISYFFLLLLTTLCFFLQLYNIFNQTIFPWLETGTTIFSVWLVLYFFNCLTNLMSLMHLYASYFYCYLFFCLAINFIFTVVFQIVDAHK